MLAVDIPLANCRLSRLVLLSHSSHDPNSNANVLPRAANSSLLADLPYGLYDCATSSVTNANGIRLENSVTQSPLATPLANPVLAVPASCLFLSSDFQEAYGSFLDESSPEAAEALEPFNWIFILASLLFLVVSYISRVVSLFTPTANFTQFALRTLPGYKVKKLLSYILKKSNTSEPSIFRKIWAAVALLIMTIYVLLKVIFDIGQSMLWEVSRTFALLRLFELTAHKDFLAFSSPSLRYNSTPHNMVFRGSVRTKYLGIWTGHGFAVDCTSIFFVGRATV